MASRFLPGTNLKREPPHAAWLYLLADLKPGSAFLIGVPGLGTLRMLAERARSVTVLPLGQRGERGRALWSADPGLATVRWIADGATLVEDLGARGDVVAILGGEGRRWLSGRAGAMDSVRRLIDRGGYAVVEGRDVSASSPERRLARATGSHLDRYRVLPLRGEPRVMVPESDAKALAHLIELGVVHPWGSTEHHSLIDKALRRIPAGLTFGRRYASLIARNRPQTAALPDYLEQMASEAGLSFAGNRWWLSVPEGYRSRKVVFRLFGPTSAHPSYVVKMVSRPEMSARLVNEGDALVRLESLGFSKGGRAPRVAFKGDHAGLAVVCESALEGRSFRESSRGSIPCSYGKAAVASLIELSVLTRSLPEDPRRRGLELVREYLEEFSRIYEDRELSAAMTESVELLATHSQGVPRVFLHGDPGTWNMLCTRDGGVGLLDWESAESTGPPLWDLFYFLRSYGVTRLGRGAGSALAAFSETFYGASELGRWTRATIANYCDQVDVERSLVQPLFRTCWMHRALKEATRLDRRTLAGGHFVNALRASLRTGDLLPASRRAASPGVRTA